MTNLEYEWYHRRIISLFVPESYLFSAIFATERLVLTVVETAVQTLEAVRLMQLAPVQMDGDFKTASSLFVEDCQYIIQVDRFPISPHPVTAQEDGQDPPYGDS